MCGEPNAWQLRSPVIVVNPLTDYLHRLPINYSTYRLITPLTNYITALQKLVLHNMVSDYRPHLGADFGRFWKVKYPTDTAHWSIVGQ